MIYRVFQDLKLSALGFGAKRQPRWRDPVHVSRSNSPAASRPISNNHFAHLSAFISEVIMSAWRWNAMLRKKDKVLVTDEERTVLILALNELRNKLIAEGKYTDAVDELMLRLAA